MLSTSLTYIVSMIALISYFCYVIYMHGMVGFLFSSAIFLIISAFVEHIEYVVIGVLIFGLTASIYLHQNPKLLDGFEDAPSDAQPSDAQPSDAQPSDAQPSKMQPSGAQPSKEEEEETPGVLSQTNIDSFDNMIPTKPADASVSTPAAGVNNAIDPSTIQKGVEAAMAQLKTTGTTKAATQKSAASKSGSSENFQEPSAGLFKLGELPSEMKKGPFVDVATTMSKAMSTLQPEQMKAMTEESQSLMDTQKNLMNMLQSMRPVLQDGRQLLDTFGSIFGGLGGLAGGASK